MRRIGGELGAATGRAEVIGLRVVCEEVRAFCRIDAHAADRIDHAGVVVMRMVMMSGAMRMVMSATAAAGFGGSRSRLVVVAATLCACRMCAVVHVASAIF
jgi:hypothetical protein